MLNPTTALLSTDGYKLFHKDAYREGIVRLYSNFTPRFGKHTNIPNGEGIIHIGLNRYLKKKLRDEFGTFFSARKADAVQRFSRRVNAYLGIDYDTTHIEALHDLGYLPLRIKSLPEGTFVPYGVACVTVENTVDGFQWLTNYIETSFSTNLWPMQTSATTSREYLKAAKEMLEDCGMDDGMLPFLIHDFSYRGMFGDEAAAMSGFAHLAVGNCGTDTLPAIDLAEDFYGANVENDLVGVSVPATEHSTATSAILLYAKNHGVSKLEAEIEYVRYLFTKASTGIVSHVSDSFDFWNFVENGLPMLHDEIMSREGKLVIRPDSGDPVEVLCGIQVPSFVTIEDAITQLDAVIREEAADSCGPGCSGFDEATEYFEVDGQVYTVDFVLEYEATWMDVGPKVYNLSSCDARQPVAVELTAEQKGLVQVLFEKFGGACVTNDSGDEFILLDEHIGAIYGDAITLERQAEIYRRLMAKGFVPMVVLGVGSYSYQMVTRDTHGSAIKGTHIEVINEDGSRECMDVCKDPKTDPSKKSATGLLRIEREDGKLVQYDQQTLEQAEGGLLEVVWEDGVHLIDPTLQNIRDVVASEL